MTSSSGGAAAEIAVDGAHTEAVRQHLVEEFEAARAQARADCSRLILLGTQTPLRIDEYAEAAEAASLSHARLAGFARLLAR